MIRVQRCIHNLDARSSWEIAVGAPLRADAVQNHAEIASPELGGDVARISRDRREHQFDEWDVRYEEVVAEVAVVLGSLF
jgi:hypothetical protein